MGLARVIRRYRKKGGGAALRYVWRLQKNRLVRIANLAGPVRKRCACCGWSGMRFLDYAGHRQNAIICPRCGSHPRHRALWLVLAQQLERLERGSAVLHLAAEQNVMPVFAPRTDLLYVTADLKLKSAMVRADVTRLPFRTNSFQLLVSSHLLEHVEHDDAAVAEFGRVLAPGSSAIIMVPMVRDWRVEATREFGSADPRREGHWRHYGGDLADRIRHSGLRCEIVSPIELTAPELVAENELMDDAIFIARK